MVRNKLNMSRGARALTEEGAGVRVLYRDPLLPPCEQNF